jgi:hypothetical protein
MNLKRSRSSSVSLGFTISMVLTLSTGPLARAETATNQQWREHRRSLKNEVLPQYGSPRRIPGGTQLGTGTHLGNGKVLVTVRRARGRTQPPAGYSGCRAYRRSGYFKTFLCNAPVSPPPRSEPVQVQAVTPQTQAPATDPDGGSNPVLPTSGGDLQSLVNTCLQPLQSRPRNIGEARAFCNSLRSLSANHPIHTNCAPLCQHLVANPNLPNSSPMNATQTAQAPGTARPPASSPPPQQNRPLPSQATANSIPPALLPQVRACVQAIRGSSFIPNSYIPQTVGGARSNCRSSMAGSAPAPCQRLCPLVQPGGTYANLPDSIPVPQN